MAAAEFWLSSANLLCGRVVLFPDCSSGRLTLRKGPGAGSVSSCTDYLQHIPRRKAGSPLHNSRPDFIELHSPSLKIGEAEDG